MRGLALCVALALVAGCHSETADPWNGTSKTKVMTSFAPYHCFALNVYGESADVRSLLTSRGPHDAEVPISQATTLAKADVLFSNGLKVDSSITRKLLQSMGKVEGPTHVKLGESLPKELLFEGDCACCKDGEHEGHAHTHKEIDGHVWLGIEQAKELVKAMASFAKKDATPYLIRLEALRLDGVMKLKHKHNRAVVPFHGSLAYFAKTFDLTLTDPIQEVPGQEPSAEHLKKILEQCRKHKVRVIAVEPQYGAETGAKVLFNEMKKAGLDPEIIVIDPLETATDAQMGPEWYEMKMRANFEALARALR